MKISFLAHCSDCFSMILPNGKEIYGYVPRGIGIGGGDDVELDIDIETGQIIGWNSKYKDEILKLESEVAK